MPCSMMFRMYGRPTVHDRDFRVLSVQPVNRQQREPDRVEGCCIHAPGNAIAALFPETAVVQKDSSNPSNCSRRGNHRSRVPQS